MNDYRDDLSWQEAHDYYLACDDLFLTADARLAGRLDAIWGMYLIECKYAGETPVKDRLNAARDRWNAAVDRMGGAR